MLGVYLTGPHADELNMPANIMNKMHTFSTTDDLYCPPPTACLTVLFNANVSSLLVCSLLVDVT